MEFREDVLGAPIQSIVRMIVPGFPPFSCLATEISEQGATLRVRSVLGIPQAFDIVIGTKRHECKVIQKAANKLRVSFNT